MVVAAGNRAGNDCAVCYAPASDPYVISVGAIDDKGTRAQEDDSTVTWSSHGFTLDKHRKPEVMAPGARIVSYMPEGTLRKEHKQNIVQHRYFRMGGTSMSAPIVSGTVALMLQADPTLTPDEVKWLLMNTARPYGGQPGGAPGVVSAEKAAFYPGTPGKANQGLTPSPLLDPSTRTITHSNVLWDSVYWSNVLWTHIP